MDVIYTGKHTVYYNKDTMCISSITETRQNGATVWFEIQNIGLSEQKNILMTYDSPRIHFAVCDMRILYIDNKIIGGLRFDIPRGFIQDFDDNIMGAIAGCIEYDNYSAKILMAMSMSPIDGSIYIEIDKYAMIHIVPKLNKRPIFTYEHKCKRLNNKPALESWIKTMLGY